MKKKESKTTLTKKQIEIFLNICLHDSVSGSNHVKNFNSAKEKLMKKTE